MFLKKKFFIFITFILFIFAALTYQTMRGGFNASGFAFLNYPFKIIGQGISTTIKGIKNFYMDYILFGCNADEHRSLNERIKKVEHEKNQCIEAKHENERLRTLLELKPQRTDYITSAEVFARDPTNWFHILWINKGKADRVAKDMVAVTSLGVVGRIYRVFNDSAAVLLITDINSSVAARIQSSRAEGILEGSGNGKCYLRYVSQDAEVEVDDVVITSGLDGIYPEGLEIGHVTDTGKKDGEFFQVIEVEPVENLKTMEEVAILRR